MSSKRTKKCIVPICKKSIISNPEKRFVLFPRNPRTKKIWFETIFGPVNEVPTTTHLYVCEDHFNLPEDSQNWMYFKTVGSCLMLKKNVIPHKNLRSSPTSPQSTAPEEPLKTNMLVVNLQKFKEENLENLRQLQRARRKLNLQVNLQKLKEENLENLRKLEEAKKKIRAKKKKKRKKKVVKKKVEIEPPKSPESPPFQTIAYLPTGLFNINAIPTVTTPTLGYNYLQPYTYVNLNGQQILPPFIVHNRDQETSEPQMCINAVPSTTAPLLSYNYLEPRTYVNICGQQIVSPSIVENKNQETLEKQICVKDEPGMEIEKHGIYYSEVEIKEEIKEEVTIKEELIEPANFEFVNMAPELENVFYNEDT